jgi:hypothetical protein
MRNLAITLALAALSVPAIAKPSKVFVATVPESAAGFKTLAECQAALRGPAKPDRPTFAKGRNRQAGTLFNRSHGNFSRCEMIEGEPMIAVYARSPRQGASPKR